MDLSWELRMPMANRQPLNVVASSMEVEHLHAVCGNSVLVLVDADVPEAKRLGQGVA